MAKYKFKCSDCDATEVLTMSIQKFMFMNSKNSFNNRECEKCDAVTKFVRIFEPTSSKILRGKEELLIEAKDEARKIVEKIKSGDTNTILEVYGEES